MNRSGLVDLLVAIIMGGIGAGLVGIFGGPGWACAGTFWIVYILYPKSNQERDRWNALVEIVRALKR